MNKSIRVKPILLSCFIFGITFFLIYAAVTTNTTVDGESQDTGVLSASAEGPVIQSESLETRSQELSILGNDFLADTSRGDLFRNTYQDQSDTADQEMNQQEASIVSDPADSANPADLAAEGTSEAADPQAPVQAAVKSETPAKPEVEKPAAAAPVSAAEAKPAVAAKAEPEPAAEAKPEPAAAEPASNHSSELDLLARLITAEAQGEPYEAQVAVGAVVMNRVKSGDWPDTIRDVIYQNIGGYYQFTPVVNGWIDKPALPECIEAAKEAMSGTDPTKGAQFYYDDKVTNTWILAKPVSAQFGHMIFAF